jgi:hypothetical protein
VRIIVLAAVTGALALCVGSASAGRGRLLVLPSTVSPGATIRVVGTGTPCRANETVYAISAAFPGKQFGGEGAFSNKAGRDGNFTIRGRTRSGLRHGRYSVSVRCGGGNLGFTAYVGIH